MSVFTIAAGASGAQEIDPDDAKYKSELWTLMQQEGGENPEFDSYRTTFVDQYGDYHDWQEDTITQHYLCRQLYLHYKQQVGTIYTPCVDWLHVHILRTMSHVL